MIFQINEKMKFLVIFDRQCFVNIVFLILIINDYQNINFKINLIESLFILPDVLANLWSIIYLCENKESSLISTYVIIAIAAVLVKLLLTLICSERFMCCCLFFKFLWKIMQLQLKIQLIICHFIFSSRGGQNNQDD